MYVQLIHLKYPCNCILGKKKKLKTSPSGYNPESSKSEERASVAIGSLQTFLRKCIFETKSLEKNTPGCHVGSLAFHEAFVVSAAVI